jgi:hypothetical protein
MELVLDAARQGGGQLSYSRNSRSNTLWPALQQLAKCIPARVVPKRRDAVTHRWLRTAYESWAKKLPS